jgi:hypothetical protein
MRNTLKYLGYACLHGLAFWFMPFYIYCSILILYWTVGQAIYHFRIRENGKGILFSIVSMLLVLLVYFKFMLNLLEAGLANAFVHIFSNH